MRKFVVLALALTPLACAKGADKIAATYVSPYQYENYFCRQIADEARRVSHRAAVLTGTQDEKATKDAVVTTVGIVIFWPALFFIGGDDQQTAELGRLRGELEAIEQASIRKRCGITFQKPEPPQQPTAQQPRAGS